jgi:general secretion pathway protein M
MQLLPSPEHGRFLAVVLLAIALALAYLFGVHWWFTARHLEIGSQISDLREQELKFREKAAERPALEQQLAEVQQFELSSPAFLPEADFESAAAGLTQRLKQVVATHATDPTRCQVIMNQYSHANDPERFERVTIKVRLRCDLEPFAGILYDLEGASPFLFVDDLQIFRQQGYVQPGQNKISTYLDIRFDLYGYIRKRVGSADKTDKSKGRDAS